MGLCISLNAVQDLEPVNITRFFAALRMTSKGNGYFSNSLIISLVETKAFSRCILPCLTPGDIRPGLFPMPAPGPSRLAGVHTAPGHAELREATSARGAGLRRRGRPCQMADSD